MDVQELATLKERVERAEQLLADRDLLTRGLNDLANQLILDIRLAFTDCEQCSSGLRCFHLLDKDLLKKALKTICQERIDALNKELAEL